MSTTIHMRCGGCEAEKEVPIHRTFRSFSGRTYGLGTYQTPSLDEATKETGWVWADPYTSSALRSKRTNSVTLHALPHGSGGRGAQDNLCGGISR